MPIIEKLYGYEVTREHDETMEALVAKYKELAHVHPGLIVVVVKEKGPSKRVLAKMTTVPKKWREIIEQMTGKLVMNVLEVYADQVKTLDSNQMTTLLYRELRRIDFDGKVNPPDVVEWEQIFRGMGKDWSNPDSTVPDLLADGMDWDKILGRK